MTVSRAAGSGGELGGSPRASSSLSLAYKQRSAQRELAALAWRRVVGRRFSGLQGRGGLREGRGDTGPLRNA